MIAEQNQASQPQPAFTRSVFTSAGGINVNPESGVFISAPPNGGPGIINYQIITAEPN